MRSPLLNSLIFLITLLCFQVCSADIDSLLAEKEAPAGVVFEIVSDESDLLGKLLPSVKTDIKILRKRFPGLPVAIVTHGSEQFALTKNNETKETRSHNLVKELVNTNNVDVHVCGTHAGWYGVTPEDFPDYVDVAVAGPLQIDDYEALGYEVIILTE